MQFVSISKIYLYIHMIDLQKKKYHVWP